MYMTFISNMMVIICSSTYVYSMYVCMLCIRVGQHQVEVELYVDMTLVCLQLGFKYYFISTTDVDNL